MLRHCIGITFLIETLTKLFNKNKCIKVNSLFGKPLHFFAWMGSATPLPIHRPSIRVVNDDPLASPLHIHSHSFSIIYVDLLLSHSPSTAHHPQLFIVTSCYTTTHSPTLTNSCLWEHLAIPLPIYRHLSPVVYGNPLAIPLPILRNRPSLDAPTLTRITNMQLRVVGHRLSQ